MHPSLEEYPHNPPIQLRWASGGGISLVRIKDEAQDPLGQVWVALFFRDIPPVGWNVGNGASENMREMQHLDALCYREFAEEYMVVPERHAPGEDSKMAVFELQNGTSQKKTSEPFVYIHNKYRKNVDGLFFSVGEHRIPFVRVDGANTSIWVSREFVNRSQPQPAKNYHLLFSLNPFEQGVETIRPYFWTLPEGYTILDGEFHLGRKVLIRRPVGLFNLRWLYQYWEEHGHSLGKPIDASVEKHIWKNYAECKVLEEVPKNQFRVMFSDFKLRKARLKRLMKGNERVFKHAVPKREEDILREKRDLYTKALTVIEKIKREGVTSLQMWNLTQMTHSIQCSREQLMPELAAFWLFRRYLKDVPAQGMKSVVDSWEDVWFEIELAATWLCDYGRLMEDLSLEQDLALKGDDTFPFRSLCPVTWKSLEIMFASKRIMEKVKELALYGVT